MGKILKILYMTCVLLLLSGCGKEISSESLNLETSEYVSAESELENTSLSDILKHQTKEDVFYNDKVNIYFFYGENCHFCKELADFFEEIAPEYGDYYNLFTFEVWNDEENRDYMTEWEDKVDYHPAGVPFYVVDDVGLSGYGEKDQKEIKKLIIEKYNAKQQQTR